MTLATIAAITATGLASLTAATFALPRHVVVERTAIVDAAPDAVLALAASNQGYQRFNPYRDADPNLKIDLFGPESGVGAGFHFDGREGRGSQTVADVTEYQVTYALDLGALGKPTQAITAVETEGGTQVTWRMQADLGRNPIFRVMGLFMDGMVGPNFERGLANIAEAAA